MNKREFLNTNVGIEIEMTGITRAAAAKIVAEHLNGTISRPGDYYDTYAIKDQQGRTWKVMSDGSIVCQKKENGRKVQAGSTYSVELVSPILKYDNDIESLQELVRKLRKAGAWSDSASQCGIHIHLDGGNHTAQSIKNFINLIYSRNGLLYKALQVKPERMRWCQELDSRLVKEITTKKPQTLSEIENIWYRGSEGESRTRHYNSTRYHFLNLHSFFNTDHHTVELRGFNGTLHAGQIRAYIVLALALNYQALTQKRASTKKPQTENEKFAMRTWLNRIGFIGDEFKACREHLYSHLDGVAAWRFGNN